MGGKRERRGGREESCGCGRGNGRWVRHEGIFTLLVFFRLIFTLFLGDFLFVFLSLLFSFLKRE